MEEVKKIVTDIKNKKYSPVYLLMGEESYYIDKIADYIEQSVLTEEERSFNQTILYGQDVTVEDIVGAAKRFPMMAEHQVIIVKEAQDLVRTIDKLKDYVNNPQQSTILVLCYKHKSLDKRKAVYKAIKKSGVVFESKKIYENQVPDWIRRVLASKKYTISPKAAEMLTEFLGTDLGKISNELDKLRIVLPQGSEITPELIEENIGISKDFNNFELRKAIGSRDMAKAVRIVNYFANNPKENPPIVTISLLFSFFVQIMKLHGCGSTNPKEIAGKIGVSPFFVNEFILAGKNYPMRRVSQVIEVIREFDGKSKGVGARELPNRDLLLELVVRIIG